MTSRRKRGIYRLSRSRRSILGALSSVAIGTSLAGCNGTGPGSPANTPFTGTLSTEQEAKIEKAIGNLPALNRVDFTPAESGTVDFTLWFSDDPNEIFSESGIHPIYSLQFDDVTPTVHDTVLGTKAKEGHPVSITVSGITAIGKSTAPPIDSKWHAFASVRTHPALETRVTDGSLFTVDLSVIDPTPLYESREQSPSNWDETYAFESSHVAKKFDVLRTTEKGFETLLEADLPPEYTARDGSTFNEVWNTPYSLADIPHSILPSNSEETSQSSFSHLQTYHSDTIRTLARQKLDLLDAIEGLEPSFGEKSKKFLQARNELVEEALYGVTGVASPVEEDDGSPSLDPVAISERVAEPLGLLPLLQAGNSLVGLYESHKSIAKAGEAFDETGDDLINTVSSFGGAFYESYGNGTVYDGISDINTRPTLARARSLVKAEIEVVLPALLFARGNEDPHVYNELIRHYDKLLDAQRSLIDDLLFAIREAVSPIVFNEFKRESLYESDSISGTGNHLHLLGGESPIENNSFEGILNRIKYETRNPEYREGPNGLRGGGSRSGGLGKRLFEANRLSDEELGFGSTTIDSNSLVGKLAGSLKGWGIQNRLPTAKNMGLILQRLDQLMIVAASQQALYQGITRLYHPDEWNMSKGSVSVRPKPVLEQVIIAPDRLVAGGKAVVAGQVENQSPVTGTVIIPVFKDDEKLTSATVTVKADETTGFSVPVTLDEPGSYDLRVGSQSTTSVAVNVLPCEMSEDQWKPLPGVTPGATGYNPSTRGPQYDSTRPYPRWAHRFEGYDIYSSTAIVGDAAFVCPGDEVMSVDVCTGQKNWHVNVPDESFVYTTPAYLNGAVYVGTSDGHVYRLDAESGEFTHSASMAQNIKGITISDGVVYVLNSYRDRARFEEELVAFSPELQTLWRADTLSSGTSGVAAIGDGRAYVGAGEYVKAISLSDEESVWVADRHYYGSDSVTYADGEVYSVSWESSSFTSSMNLAVLDAETGDYLRWTKSAPPLYTQPIVTGTEIIAGGRRGLYVFDRQSLEIIRTHETTAGVYARPVVTPEWIYVGTGDGSVEAFKRKSTDPSWRYWHSEKGGKIVADLAAVNGILFVSDTSGHYYALG